MELVKQNQYQEKISQGLVLVDFFATWCQPCKMLQCELEKLEKHYSTVRFVAVDTDEQALLAKQLKVLSLPTMFIYRDGCLLKEINGYYPAEVIEKLLNHYL